MNRMTDLALEAHALWKQSAARTTENPGVRARERKLSGVTVNEVEILDARGEQALGKPVGRYVTVDLAPLKKRLPDAFSAVAQVLAGQLRGLCGLPEEACVLVVGLGNPAVTPDAVGPRTLSHLLVTRHLRQRMPEHFARFRPVCATAPGVLGTTGMESVEVVRGVIAHARPSCVIAVDALAAVEPRRLCALVQLADSGIVPGSGIGNARDAFNAKTLGVPTISIGVPTVIRAEAFGEGADDTRGMIVTPSDIDERVGELARLLGTAINLALHDALTPEELACYVG